MPFSTTFEPRVKTRLCSGLSAPRTILRMQKFSPRPTPRCYPSQICLPRLFGRPAVQSRLRIPMSMSHPLPYSEISEAGRALIPWPPADNIGTWIASRLAQSLEAESLCKTPRLSSQELSFDLRAFETSELSSNIADDGIGIFCQPNDVYVSQLSFAHILLLAAACLMVQKHNHGVPFSLADILDIALRTPLPPLDHDEIYEAARQIQLPAPDEEEELEIAQLIPLPPLDHNEVYEMACQIPLPAPDSDEVLETAQLTQLPPLDHDEVCEAARQIPLPPPDSDEVLETAQFTCLPSLDDEEILESARLTLLPPPDQEEIFQFSLLVSLPAPDVEESYSWALQIVLPAIDAEEELYFNTAEGEIAPYIKLSPSALRRKRRFALKVRQEQFSETFKMVPQATSSMVGCESNEQAAEISKIAPAVPLLTSESIEQAAETSKLVSESPPTAVVCGSTERPLTTRKQRQRANRRLGYGPKAASVSRETSELAPLPVSAATAVDNSEVTTGTNESPESASLINRAQVPVHSSARANTGFYHNAWEEQETPLCPFPVHVDPYIPSSAYLGPLDEVDRRIAWMEANAMETNWERSSSTSSAARNRPSHSLCMRRR